MQGLKSRAWVASFVLSGVILMTAGSARATGNSQGRDLQGTKIDGFWLGIAGTIGGTAYTVSIRRGTIETQPPLPPNWPGALVVHGQDGAGHPIVAEIRKIGPHEYTPWTAPGAGSASPKPVAGVTDYEVRFRSGGAWRPLCDGSPNRAIPGVGRWGRDGHHRLDPARFSFSCADGVVTKCINWGYAPWAPAVGEDYHQACTRMARADYCYDGTSHTVEGTVVDYYDFLTPPVAVRTEPEPPFYREAVWPRDEKMPATDEYRPVLCLSKKRWSTIPLGGYCASKLPDPRQKNASFCDDLPDTARDGADSWASRGGILFNNSTLIDAPLQRWSAVIGGDWYSAAVAAPPAGTPSEHEGAVYNLATQPAYRPATARALLQSFASAADHLTVTDQWFATFPGKAAYTKIRDEGYIFRSNAAPADLPGTSRRLYLYKCGADYVTTIAATLPGCAQQALLGHLPIGYLK